MGGAVIYGPGFSGGDVLVPASKSAAHRALICAALSGGRCEIDNIQKSDDMLATLGALRALGAEAKCDPAAQSVLLDASGVGAVAGGTLDCLASGSSLRFLIPVAAALGGEFTFTGRDRLPQRPIGIYEDLLPAHGVQVETAGGLPLTISGRLLPGEYRLPGNVSSQFITGLLLALPLLEGESRIRLTSPLESAGYVDLTLSVLRDFGVTALPEADGWRVPGGQRFAARSYRVEGDWSQAAFFLSMAALDPNGKKVRIHGLKPDSVQSDRACVERFEAFGLRTAWEGDVLAAWNPQAHRPYGGLRGCRIDAAQIPDLVPALAVTAALAQGETVISGAARLRIKESDRLAAMEAALNALGGRARATADGLVLTGVPALAGGEANGEKDHRVVMALAAAALRSTGTVRVTDPWSIRKSYPGFFEDFNRLGGNAHVVDVG